MNTCVENDPDPTFSMHCEFSSQATISPFPYLFETITFADVDNATVNAT
jgi:hypothetical protein